jgi:signal peptidase II
MSNRGTTPRSWGSLVWFVLAAVTGGGCDLATKAWAEGSLVALPGRSMVVLEPWLELALHYNRGTAFSFVPDLGAVRWILGLVAILVAIVLLFVVVRTRASRVDAFALGMVAGGAIGNGIDRMFNFVSGGGTGVVDFIKVNYPWGGSWPTFNIADVLIAVGVAMLLLSNLLGRGKRQPERPERASGATRPSETASPRAGADAGG